MDKFRFSVIMPTYNQCAFIRRAILSLMKQTYEHWELIVINDGCTDETEELIADYLLDSRIRYIKNTDNQGIGSAINQGLDIASNELIAYLPSDDFFYENHLAVLAKTFEKESQTVLAFSGLKWDNRDSLHGAKEIESIGIRQGYCLQPVQVAHRKTKKRWIERRDFVCEDYFLSFWNQLLEDGLFVRTNLVTTFWTQHPAQRHRKISEKHGGGINIYRNYYRVKNPIRIKVAREKTIDENSLYQDFRLKKSLCDKPLKILLVGELAYNPERIYAFEEAGHILFGLWCPIPALSFSSVGPLPFGNVIDIDRDNWCEDVKRVKPDIIYGLLNWGSIDWTYDVVRTFPDIPFAWHYKEGPHIAISSGNWYKLVYLYYHADVKIYLNNIAKQWFEQFIPNKGLSMVMDGDLPKKDYFKDKYSAKLSEQDGEIHTVIAGRMIGIGENTIRVLAQNKIHIHLYLENFHASRAKVFQHYRELFPQYFHLHNHCSANNWTQEFSKYDAAWLHCTEGNNDGNLMKASWDDLNIPARISCYAAAGLPVISPTNSRCISAINETIRKYDIGILFNDIFQLTMSLKNKEFIVSKQNNMKKHRMKFSFDYYVPEMIALFNQAIKKKKTVYE